MKVVRLSAGNGRRTGYCTKEGEKNKYDKVRETEKS
jgi:hypothetical protein